MPKLSVIIPCYNVKKEYLDKCINSILNQTYQDYEVILVDDGSVEPYNKDLEGIRDSDRRIILYKQDNQGVSVARNVGVEMAKGEYVCFIDADDYVLPYYFEQAVNIAEEKKAEILYSYVYRNTGKQCKPFQLYSPEIKKINPEWIKKYTLGSYYHDGDKFFGRGPWARILKSEIAKSHPFPVGVPIGEDVLWNLSIINDICVGYIADCIWYIYELRNDSVTCKYDPYIPKRLKPFYARIGSFIKNDVDRLNYYNRVFNDLRRYIFKLYIGNPENMSRLISKWKQFEEICSDQPWSDIKKRDYYNMATIKQKIKWIMLKMHIIFLWWIITARISYNLEKIKNGY